MGGGRKEPGSLRGGVGAGGLIDLSLHEDLTGVVLGGGTIGGVVLGGGRVGGDLEVRKGSSVRDA